MSERFCFWVGCLVFISSTHSVEGALIVVGPGGTGDYETISEALVASASGDDIWVRAGRYNEAIEMKEGVALYAGFPASGTPEWEDRDWAVNETIIDATGLDSSAVFGADHATLDGFTVTGGNASTPFSNEYGGGVCCHYTSPALVNCTITGNTAFYGGGLGCEWEASPKVIGCTIQDNTARTGGGVSSYKSLPTLERSTIVENRATLRGGGLYCEYFGSGMVVHCTIADNEAPFGSGIYCEHQSSVMVLNSILWNAGMEIGMSESEATATYSCLQGGWPGKGNIGADPAFADAAGDDYRLLNGSCCINAGTDAGLSYEGPAPDMGAWEAPAEYAGGPCTHVPRVRYVRSDAPPGGNGDSWAEAFGTLEAALRVSSTSDEVWVAAGRYNESIRLEPCVGLYGGFTGTESNRAERDWKLHETIIDATGLDSSTVFAADSSLLDGFTVTGGRSVDVSGGGVAAHWSLAVAIRNCLITGNWAHESGGGVYCAGASRITNCTITANSCSLGAGGGANCGGTTILKDCTIADNWARDCGGIALRDYGSLIRCTITGNEAGYGGGGVSCWGSPLIRDCTIAANTSGHSGGGIAVGDGASPSLTNCLIAGNRTYGDGGGIFCNYESAPTIANCIFNGNWADSGGALSAPVYYVGDAALVNSILWGDAPDEILLWHPSTTPTPEPISPESPSPGSSEIASPHSPEDVSVLVTHGWTVSFSCIEGGFYGLGNIKTDPRFVQPWDGSSADLHLQTDSPCIDRGDNEAAVDIPTDLDGNVRIWDGDDVPGAVVDMGAYEFGAPYPGDTDGDRRITSADLFTFSCWWEDERTTENAVCDPTGDRNIDHEDLLWFLPHWCREQ